jgi:hypothetical protein
LESFQIVCFQQHFTWLQEEALLPLSQVFIMALAQPTPGVTVMAFDGQLVAHAPHSMHPLKSTILAL